MATVWGWSDGGGTAHRTRTLDSHVSRLRRKLSAHGASYVVNVWGVGYRLMDVPAPSRPGDVCGSSPDWQPKLGALRLISEPNAPSLAAAPASQPPLPLPTTGPTGHHGASRGAGCPVSPRAHPASRRPAVVGRRAPLTSRHLRGRGGSIGGGLGCKVGESGLLWGTHAGTRVAGLLPPSHPGSNFGQAHENP